MSERIEIHEGVLVLEVVVDDARVSVDVYGSSSNVCGTVRFTFPDRSRRRRRLHLLRRWRDELTPLTLVSIGSTVSLQDPATTFGVPALSAHGVRSA